MRTPASLLAGLMLASLSFIQANGQAVRINEVMSSNATTLADEDGEFSDWIELYNPASTPVDLTGYGLSDDPDRPFRWTFPALTLPANGFALVFASGKDRPGFSGHWETVVDRGDLWRYSTAQPASAWKSAGFDDAAWPSGPSGFGYGDGDDATAVSAGTLALFARTTFTLGDTVGLKQAFLHVDYDDGFVAYLNGVEIARSNIGTPGDEPSAAQAATTDREAHLYAGGEIEAFRIEDIHLLLQEGENVLAVQVHNNAANSSDLTLIPLLTFGFAQQPTAPRGLSATIGEMPWLPAHTSFSVSSGGETLALTAPDGTLTDQVDVPRIPSDFTFGRSATDAATWAFFDVPTPGLANSVGGYEGFTPAVSVSPAAGLYETFSVGVELDAGLGAGAIHYTLDASEPTPSSPLYRGPITLTRTTVVRARVFRDGYVPGPIGTRAYLFNESPHLPVVSLVTDPPNLWLEEKGIYILGPNAESWDPHFGANYWQDWERPVHFSLFNPEDGHAEFEADLGFRIYGGWSRMNAQKSLAFYARSQYGPGEIDYKLFPDGEIDEFQAFVLRNSGNDWPETLFRDGLMQTLVEDTEIDRLGYRPTTVFLNGAYWGIHNLREKINEHYVASHHGVDPDAIDMVEIVSREADLNVIHGTSDHYNALVAYVQSHAMTSADDYAYVKEAVDIENYIDYMAAQIYFANTDWPGNNVKLWRPQTPDGRWRWILYDTDFGFGLYDAQNGFRHETLRFASDPNGPEWPNPPHSTILFRSLLKNADFKRDFVNRMSDLLNGPLRSDHAVAQVNSIHDLLQPEMARHLTRWNRGSVADWEGRVYNLRRFAEMRPQAMRGQMQSFFSLGANVAVAVNAAPAEGGTVRVNRLVVDSFPWTGSYYAGLPLTLTAEPMPGYRFAGWTGSTAGSDAALTINPAAGASVVAHFEKQAIAGSDIVITEIQPDPPPTADTDDWVELYNRSETSIDISGWIFSDDDDDHRSEIPSGTTIAGGGALILCRDAAAFDAVFAAQATCGATFSFGLGKSGDAARLYDASDVLVDSVQFTNEAPWPVRAEDEGRTLELFDPSDPNELGANWMLSALPGGTPGLVAIAIATETEEPLAFALEANYPNPFSGSTTIPYVIEVPGAVRLRVYDVLGREVRTLEDSVLPEGRYSAKFDANGLAPGLYLCRLEAPGGSRVMQMVVVR